jgi:hypothetical protein
MNRQQQSLLNQLDYQHCQLKGVIDAMLLVDDHHPQHTRLYREAIGTLHNIAAETVGDAKRAIEAIYKAGKKANK